MFLLEIPVFNKAHAHYKPVRLGPKMGVFLKKNQLNYYYFYFLHYKNK